jgi:hypothetical protein
MRGLRFIGSLSVPGFVLGILRFWLKRFDRIGTVSFDSFGWDMQSTARDTRTLHCHRREAQSALIHRRFTKIPQGRSPIEGNQVDDSPLRQG